MRYLVKPLEAKVFLKELRAVLQQWSGRAAPAPVMPLDVTASHAMHESVLARKLEDKIAQLEQTNRRLQESETRFRSLTEMSSDFYWESDAEHRLTQRTSAAKKSSAVSVFESGAQVGQRRWDIPYLSPDEAGWAAHRALLDAHQPFRDFVLSRLGADGSERFISISGDPVFDAAGTFTGYRGVGTDITARRRIGEELHASEERWKFALEGAGDGVWDRNLQTGEVHFSRRWKEMLGYADEEISPRQEEWLSRIHPEDLPRVMADVKACTEGSRVTYANERRMRCKDGSWKWILARGSVVSQSPDGRPLRMIGTHTDITERKRAEEALRASEDRYRDLVENSRDLICTHDLEGRLLSVNAAAVRLTGFAREALLGMNLADLLTQGARAGFPAYLDALRTRGAARGLMHIRTAQGEARWWEYDNTLRSDGVAAPVVRGMAQDVTEVRLAERARKSSEDKFSRAFQLNPDAININRLEDGLYVSVNRGFTRIIGYGEAELLGRTSLELDIWADPADRARLVEGLRNEGVVTNLEARFRTKDGRILDGLMSASIIDIDGVPHVISITRDVSERKQVERQMQEYVGELENAFMSTVKVATTLGEMRDPYTAGHQRRVAEIAVAIGAEMGLDARGQEGLRVAGYLHDIGKINIPAEMLSKPGKLSAVEYQLIKGHAQSGYDVLKDVEFPWPVAEVALQHHERVDGSGYPQGLKGEAIVLEARIMAVADVVEAMSSHRPYRAGLGIDNALAEIERGSGGVYDSKVADACLRLFREKGYSIPI